MGDRERPTFGGAVDAHVHVGGSYRSWQEWQRHAVAHQITGAVLVQEMASFDNSTTVAAARAAGPDHWAIVRVDEQDPAVAEQLSALATDPVVRGVRLTAATRSPGADPYALWRAIADHGLLASVRGPLTDLVDGAFHELLTELPQLSVRLEHIGCARFGIDDPATVDRLCGLATHPRVGLMWSGYYANADGPWPYPSVWPVLRDTLQAYGAGRIMWSGDWNALTLAPDRSPDALAADQRLLDHPPLRHAVGLTDADLELIMGGTVRRFLEEDRS